MTTKSIVTFDINEKGNCMLHLQLTVSPTLIAVHICKMCQAINELPFQLPLVMHQRNVTHQTRISWHVHHTVSNDQTSV